MSECESRLKYKGVLKYKRVWKYKSVLKYKRVLKCGRQKRIITCRLLHVIPLSRLRLAQYQTFDIQKSPNLLPFLKKAKSMTVGDEVISRKFSNYCKRRQTSHLRHRTVELRKKPAPAQGETHKAERNPRARNFDIFTSCDGRRSSHCCFAVL